MLVLSRKVGESIRIGAEIQVKVVGISGGQIKLAIAAPRSESIYREEIYEKIADANRHAVLDGSVDSSDLVDIAKEAGGNPA